MAQGHGPVLSMSQAPELWDQVIVYTARAQSLVRTFPYLLNPQWTDEKT